MSNELQSGQIIIGFNDGPTAPSGVQSVEGDTASGAADTGNPIKIGGVALANQPTAVDDGDRVESVFTLNKELVPAGYDWLVNALRTYVTNPGYANNQIVTYPTVNVGASGTDTTSIVFDMGNYNGGVVIQVVVTGTGTAQWSVDANSVSAAAGAPWDDVTEYGFSSDTSATAASYSASQIIHSVSNFMPGFFRLNFAETGGVSAVAFDVTVRKF